MPNIDTIADYVSNIGMEYEKHFSNRTKRGRNILPQKIRSGEAINSTENAVAVN